MSKETVDGLVARGRGAAAKLVARFAGDMPGITVTEGWRNQQWIRLRCATRGIADWVGQFDEVFSEPAGHSPYRTLAGDDVDGDMPSYALTVARRQEFNARIDELLELAERWSMPPKDVFSYNAPSPAPSLGLIPSDRVDAPGRP